MAEETVSSIQTNKEVWSHADLRAMFPKEGIDVYTYSIWSWDSSVYYLRL